jgi:hypothetical protein
MHAFEIHEHKIDGATNVFFFARTDGEDRSSAAAYDRARAKISGKDNTSLLRQGARRRAAAAVCLVRHARQCQACP